VAEKTSVTVQLRGRELRIRGTEDEASLQRVARHLDETMARLEQRSGKVDSLDVALLTALNLAREVIELREGRSANHVDSRRLRSLIETVESGLAEPRAR
jgi:cell division protein ZapA (FtsZ GTPase activity inhibitor)